MGNNNFKLQMMCFYGSEERFLFDLMMFYCNIHLNK